MLFSIVPAALLAIVVVIIAAIIIEVKNKSMENASGRRLTTPRDFFLHLGTIVTLYMAVAALLTLLFNVIDFAFPDALSYSYYYGSYDPYSGAVRWSIAMLVVVFPLFWFLTWVLGKGYERDPETRNLPIRKWLVYFTLFLAGIAIMIDLIVLINTFLGGEITTRFALKVLSVLVVTGLVFGYYVTDLRAADGSRKRIKTFLMIGAVLIIASIVTGFFVMGSPGKQRKLQFDMRRTNDLSSIQSQVIYSYWQRKGELPNSLEDLQDPISSFMVPSDPETGNPYEYKKTGERSFELCAEFSYPTQKYPQPNGSMVAPDYYGVRGVDNWNHEAGRQCFERTVDPELYPVYKDFDAKGRPVSGTIPPPAVPVGYGIPDDPGTGSGPAVPTVE